MLSPSVLSGAKAIGRALGMSERTVRRQTKAGLLPAFKTGQNTSPLKLERKELPRLRGRDEAAGA